MIFQDQQYSKWMAACKLASKGRTLADASYEGEVNEILAFLQLQRPAAAPAINPNSLGDIVPEDYITPRYAKKLKNKVGIKSSILNVEMFAQFELFGQLLLLFLSIRLFRGS